MLAILRETLDQTASPEFIGMIDEAHDLFDRFELEDFTLEFEDLLAVSDNQDAGSLNTQVYELTQVLQNQILAKHLITLNHDTNVVQANHILTCLRLIETTEYCERIQDICSNESDPTDAFVEVLSIVGGLPVEALAPLVDHVEISLMKRIAELSAQRIENESRAQIDHQSIEETLIKYKAFADGLHLEEMPLVAQYITQGAQVQEPFAVYCQFIRDNLTSVNPDEIASQYIAAALLANDVPSLFKDSIKEVLNEVYTDIDTLTPILISVDKQLIEMETRLNAGIKKVDHE